MYDDIAYNKENPRPGVIINSPRGEDVYNGVPKVSVWTPLAYFSWDWIASFFFNADFPWNRIMLEKMLPSTTFLPFFLGTKLQLKEGAEKLWTAVQMIIYSYTTLIMVVLGCLVSNLIATSSICIHHLIYWVLYFVESFWT